MTNSDTIKMIANGNFEGLFSDADYMTASVIKSRLQSIPSQFFEPRIEIDDTGTNKISLVQFSAQIADMPIEKRNGLMERYNIDPYDMGKLQSIIESINIVREYGSMDKDDKNDKAYGFSLSSHSNLDKAYPLWLAFLYANSINPLIDIKAKLKEDGMEGKYEPETIMELIKHTNELMEGKTENEKKDFYMKSISGILQEKDDETVEVER